MKIDLIRFLLSLCLLTVFTIDSFSNDSIKVYFLGYFKKNENFLITYTEKAKHVIKVEERYFADTFWLEIDTAIRPFERMQVGILRLNKPFKRYKDTNLFIFYEPERKYLVI